MDMTSHWRSAVTADYRHLRKPSEARGLREPDLVKVLNDRNMLDHTSGSGYDIHHERRQTKVFSKGQESIGDQEALQETERGSLSTELK